MIRKSPIICRRSGVRKFEIDLRQPTFRLARSPLQLVGIVFLSAQSAGKTPLLKPLSKTELRSKLMRTQAYGSRQPQWQTFSKNAAQLGAFELRRGHHPLEAIEALRSLLT